MSTPEQRASDQDRERTADLLRDAAAAGRLEPDELDERLGTAFAARTHGELAALTADVQPVAVDRAATKPRLWDDREVRGSVIGLASLFSICTLVWLASGADGSFWPVWVLVGMGIAVIGSVSRALKGEDAQGDDSA